MASILSRPQCVNDIQYVITTDDISQDGQWDLMKKIASTVRKQPTLWYQWQPTQVIKLTIHDQIQVMSWHQTGDNLLPGMDLNRVSI